MTALVTVLAATPPGPVPIAASDIVVLVIKSVIVVFFLLAGFRVLGKRETSQLTVYDLAMLFALSNAVQNAMTAGKGNLAVGLATSSAVVIAAWLLTRVLYRTHRLQRLVLGSPVILVHDGQVLLGRQRRCRVSDDELAAAMRSVGLDGTSDAALAVLEVDGSISVCPRIPKRAGGDQDEAEER